MIRYILISISSILTIFSTYAITIVQDTKPIIDEPIANEGLRAVLVYGGSFFIIILLILLVMFIMVKIILKITNMIRDFNRKKKDFLFYNFESNLKLANNNRDYTMKKRRKRTLFLTWKRAGVFIQNDSEGLRQIGEYNGETYKKEGFFAIAIYNKLGMFKVMETMILIPLEIKEKLVKKVEVEGKKILIINCEGLDEVGSTDYYLLPLIRDNKDKNKFVDFSDLIRKNYTEKIVYRDEIKELLQQSKEATIKAVESNPNIQMKRRTQ